MSVLRYEFPLSKVMGKIRIKERFAFSDYGIPVPPTQSIITHKHYIEWQIGYDRVISKGEEAHFIGANGKKKQIYELSEFLDFGLGSGLIDKKVIKNLINNIQNNQDLIDEKEQITRTNFITHSLGGIEFLKSSVSYPLLVYRFQSQDILCEIIVREKQFAVGTMPMLYFCLALSSIKDSSGGSFIGRRILSKECGYLEVNRDTIHIFMQIFRIFGLLSKAHKQDCLAILAYLLKKQF
ncbi:R.Pab1 family restriction endonuclease [uncultured Campylobacter sp.]|uniref:R.Pab1 family restriction endonuclease n=1 Tax=uncultured Campylobacter sp. TaxID=218934 RepID=UPI0026310050|nr:R.Pab1 family restriction endonuclease [uncultured Campylobacter sp.]